MPSVETQRGISRIDVIAIAAWGLTILSFTFDKKSETIRSPRQKRDIAMIRNVIIILGLSLLLGCAASDKNTKEEMAARYWAEISAPDGDSKYGSFGYRDFLQKWGDSQYAEEAQKRLDKLEYPDELKKLQYVIQDARKWQNASGLERLCNFYVRYPNSEYNADLLPLIESKVDHGLEKYLRKFGIDHSKNNSPAGRPKPNHNLFFTPPLSSFLGVAKQCISIQSITQQLTQKTWAIVRNIDRIDTYDLAIKTIPSQHHIEFAEQRVSQLKAMAGNVVIDYPTSASVFQASGGRRIGWTTTFSEKTGNTSIIFEGDMRIFPRVSLSSSHRLWIENSSGREIEYLSDSFRTIPLVPANGTIKFRHSLKRQIWFGRIEIEWRGRDVYGNTYELTQKMNVGA